MHPSINSFVVVLLPYYNFVYQIIEHIPYSTVHHTSAPIPTIILHTIPPQEEYHKKHTENRRRPSSGGPILIIQSCRYYYPARSWSRLTHELEKS
mmetsp:Transcript_36400/g.41637  ORF Transcript_36400/g.41637 Transcript_36400/m.41637 type:complete len:95 (-) Transcript_36400:414-698(-)